MNTALLTAYECLNKIYTNKAFSTIELNQSLYFCKKKDKALITKIVYGVLENDLQLEYVISQFCKKLKPKLKLYLKLGTYCLMNLSIPANAVVNDVVELSKNTGKIQLVGFVNATLKNIAKSAHAVVYPSDKISYLSTRYSYPEWAVKKLIKDYTLPVAEKIISHRLSQENVLRVNLSKITVEKFCTLLDENGISHSKTEFEDVLRVKGSFKDIDETFYTFQSLGSIYVCKAVNPQGKCKILDCCSAPGGKSIYLKQMNENAEVHSFDFHAHRVALVESYAKRMNVKLNTKVQDGTQNCEQLHEQFDYVLIDAPCSGYGVVDNHPDIKIFREEQDVSSLMKTQRAILATNKNYVKKGGVLVYSTCTFFKNESEEMVQKFLKENTEFQLEQLPIQKENDGTYRFLPHKDNVQGFFVARMRRTR